MGLGQDSIAVHSRYWVSIRPGQQHDCVTARGRGGLYSPPTHVVARTFITHPETLVESKLPAITSQALIGNLDYLGRSEYAWALLWRKGELSDRFVVGGGAHLSS
jgi:hypothetical protein